MSNNIQFIPMVCPNCGGQLMVSEKQDKAICSYCGNPFLLSHNPNASHESAENYLKLARTAQELEQFDDAVNYYNKALELEPENYLAWYGKAFAHGWKSSVDDYFIGEAITYFDKAIENAPQTEKSTIEQNAAVDIALMCGSLSYALREYYIEYANALGKVAEQNVNLYSEQLKIADIYFRYQTYMYATVCSFDSVLGKIINKRKIQASLSQVVLGLTTMRKILITHYREEGLFSTKYIPDKFLKLDSEKTAFVESHYEKFVNLLKSLEANN